MKKILKQADKVNFDKNALTQALIIRHFVSSIFFKEDNGESTFILIPKKVIFIRKIRDFEERFLK